MANTGKSELTSREKIEYDELVARLARKSPEELSLTMLSPIETTVLLSISIGKLDRSRGARRDMLKSGEPIAPTSYASIPFAQADDEGKIQYFATDVRDFLERLWKSARSPHDGSQILFQGDGFRRWMAEGTPSDTWPFTILASGRPLDFMQALSDRMLTGDAQRLTLGEFGAKLADAASSQFRAEERAALDKESSHAPEANSVDVAERPTQGRL
jgi:hypothetical protein